MTFDLILIGQFRQKLPFLIEYRYASLNCSYDLGFSYEWTIYPQILFCKILFPWSTLSTSYWIFSELPVEWILNDGMIWQKMKVIHFRINFRKIFFYIVISSIWAQNVYIQQLFSKLIVIVFSLLQKTIHIDKFIKCFLNSCKEFAMVFHYWYNIGIYLLWWCCYL